MKYYNNINPFQRNILKCDVKQTNKQTNRSEYKKVSARSMVSMLFHKFSITVALFCFSGVLFLSIYFHSCWDIIIVREGMQILIYAHYAQLLRSLSSEGFVSVPHLLWHRATILMVNSEESMTIALRFVVHRARTSISRIRGERSTTERMLYYSSHRGGLNE